MIDTININGTLENSIELKGNINTLNLKGKLDNSNNIIDTINTGISLIGNLYNNALNGLISIGGGSYLDYSGEYEITPQVDAQTLNTKNKVLRDDMTIKKIPYYETSNESGYTAYIGSEVEIDGN